MKRIFLLLLGAGLLLSCGKDDLLLVTSDAATALTPALRSYAPATQTFPFALGQPQTLRTAAGATLSFPANAFRLPDGQTLATGQAELRVREIYTVADMLLANIPTTADNGQHLISGGEFSIQAWQGTTRLRLANNPATAGTLGGLTLNSPAPPAGLDTTRMELWQQPARTFAPAGPDSSGWRRAVPGRPTWVASAAPGRYAVTIPLDSIALWNIDQFWHAYHNGTVTTAVEVPAGATDTRVYFRPVGFNGLARTVATPSATRWSCRLPLGAPVVAVVVQIRGSQLYYGTQAVTTQANQVMQPPLEALSEAEIVRRIRLL